MVTLTIAAAGNVPQEGGGRETPALGREPQACCPEISYVPGVCWRCLGDRGALALLVGLDQTCGFMAVTGELTSGPKLERTLPDVPL